MKNIIIVVLLLCLIGLGIFVLKREGITSIKDLTANLERTIDNTVESVKSSVDSSLQTNSAKIPDSMSNLPGDTVFSLVLPAKAILPAITHLEGVLLKLKSSSLGKKLKINEMIDQNMQAAQKSAADEIGAEPRAAFDNTEPSFQEIVKNLKNFEKLDLLLRAKTLEGKSTPLLKINAAFKDDSYSKQLQQTLDGLVETSKEGDGPQLKKDEKDPETYVIKVKPPLAPIEVDGQIKSSGKEINATLALMGGSVTAAATNSSQTESSVSDTVISRSAISKDAFGSYINISNLRSLIQIAEVLVSDKTKSDSIRKAFESSFGVFNSSAGNASFENGLKSNSCTRYNIGANAFSSLKSAVDSSANSKSEFYKLISPRTTLAVRMDVGFAAANIESMASGLAATSQNAEISATPNASTATLLQQFKIAQEEIKKLKLKDLGIIANAPTMSFVPDVGIYLEHDATISIDQFSEVLQSLFKKLAPPSISNQSPIIVSKDSSGKTQVIVPVMDGYQLTFRAISPTQLLGSIQENYFDEAKNLLSQTNAFIDDAKLATKNVNVKISNNDNLWYLSTSSLMPLVRQFAPFIAMSKPELKITDSELNQFLEIFDFNVIATSKNTSPEDLLICTTGEAAVF